MGWGITNGKREPRAHGRHQNAPLASPTSQNPFSTARITLSPQAAAQENAAALGGIAARGPAAAGHGILGEQRQQPRPSTQPEQGRPRPSPVPAEKGQEEKQVPLPHGPRGPAAPRHRLGGLRGSLGVVSG